MIDDICSRSVLRAAEPDLRGHKRAADAHHLLCLRYSAAHREKTAPREGKLAVTMKRARTQLEELAGDANVWDRQSKRKKLKNKAKGGGNQDE